MGLKKDFILTGAYFLILSTVLEAQDAFVYYYDSQFPLPKETIKNNRGKMLIAFGLFSIINYFTLILAPYINCSIQKLSLLACGILLIKYGCELIYYTKILTFIFELGAIFADIIGTGLFYLTIIRIIQILIDRHGLKQRSGLCFGGAIALYAFSILLGYAIGYLFFEETPTWLFVISLTTFTIIAAIIGYFAFSFKDDSQQDNRNQNNQNNQQEGAENGAGGFQIIRNNLNFINIIKFTLTTYKKIFPLIGVQTMLGTLFAYGYSLLQFLIWTSQTEQIDDKLEHNKYTMILYSAGGIFTSILIGFICDKLSIRKLGYGMVIYNGLSLVFLYFAIYIKYFYTTLILFMFLGMTQFAVFVWLLAACSRLYKGIFEVLAANSQLIAISGSAYGLGVIFFENRMNPQTKLSLQLAALIVMNIISFFFIKKLPDQTITIQYLVEELQDNSNQSPQGNNQQRQYERQSRELPVEIEMANQKDLIENKINEGQTIDPQNLL